MKLIYRSVTYIWKSIHKEVPVGDRQSKHNKIGFCKMSQLMILNLSTLHYFFMISALLLTNVLLYLSVT